MTADGSVSVEEAAQFIGCSPDEPILPALLATAVDSVNNYLRPSGVRRCPGSIWDHAVKAATSELWLRRNAPGGVASWSPDGSTAIRMSADFMKPVYPLLDPYRGIGAIG